MEFKKLTSEDISNSPSYIIAVTILNMEDEFKAEDVYEKLREELAISGMGKDELKILIRNKLETLMNNGSVIQRDTGYYSCREGVI